MSVPAAGRTLTLLAALAAALVAAFVVAPRMLAAGISGRGFVDERGISEAFRTSFVEYWAASARDFTPDVQSIVDYWFAYHLVKAVIAAILLIVLVVLGVLLWKAFLSAGVGKRGALASGGVLAVVAALFSVVLVAANIQGALAPFASLLPMLTVGAANGELADTLGQVKQQLADSLSGRGQNSPALDAMIDDFARYHLVLAVIAAIVAVILSGISVGLFKRFASSRRVQVAFGALSALVSIAVIVVAVANAATAADPEPALSAFFDGGW